MINAHFWLVLAILIINLLIVVGYYIFMIFLLPIFYQRQNRRDQVDRRKCYITCIVMFFCPLIGEFYFVLSYVFYRLFFRRTVDLADVVFSKDRVKSLHRGDDEMERNIVPLEEALAVSDKQSLRTLMLNILKGDISDSLHSVSEALNSKDSETAHYAASALRDELNNFRTGVQDFYTALKKDDANIGSSGGELLNYMNAFLAQNVFSQLEQKTYVQMMDEVATIMYTKEQTYMKSLYYEWVCMRLLEVKDFENCEKWCLRAKEQYPSELGSYTCLLNLYFEKQQKEDFFRVMKELKSSNVAIDRETLEMIRTFS
jgi:hypothetical protein